MNVGDTLTLLDIYRIWVEIPGDRPWSAAAAASHGNAVRVFGLIIALLSYVVTALVHSPDLPESRCVRCPISVNRFGRLTSSSIAIITHTLLVLSPTTSRRRSTIITFTGVPRPCTLTTT